jgi:hypothetical protein
MQIKTALLNSKAGQFRIFLKIRIHAAAASPAAAYGEISSFTLIEGFINFTSS